MQWFTFKALVYHLITCELILRKSILWLWDVFGLSSPFWLCEPKLLVDLKGAVFSLITSYTRLYVNDEGVALVYRYDNYRLIRSHTKYFGNPKAYILPIIPTRIRRISIFGSRKSFLCIEVIYGYRISGFQILRGWVVRSDNSEWMNSPLIPMMPCNSVYRGIAKSNGWYQLVVRKIIGTN